MTIEELRSKVETADDSGQARHWIEAFFRALPHRWIPAVNIIEQFHFRARNGEVFHLALPSMRVREHDDDRG